MAAGILHIHNGKIVAKIIPHNDFLLKQGNKTGINILNLLKL
jgi:hypothetical protein